MLCHSCGAQIAGNAKFCDNCGTQTVTEQAAIQEQQKQNADAYANKSINGSVWITVGMAVFSAFFIIFFGFEEGEARVATITAIAFSVFICGFKWFFEIKNQMRWKKDAEEKTKGSDRHAL